MTGPSPGLSHLRFISLSSLLLYLLASNLCVSPILLCTGRAAAAALCATQPRAARLGPRRYEVSALSQLSSKLPSRVQ
jgi:hypothetical protein